MVSTIHAEGTVMWLDGEHDAGSLHDLTETIAKAISVGDADLVVDLSGATYISMATIGELLRAQTFLRDHSRELKLRSPSPSAMSLLDACGLIGAVESDTG